MIEPLPREEAPRVSPDDYVTAGYPVHRVFQHWTWVNPHLAVFTDYVAVCGFEATASGEAWSALGHVREARRGELCRVCWPSGHPLQRR